jgi:hypothetical protein
MSKLASHCLLRSAPESTWTPSPVPTPVDVDLWSGLPCPIPPS